MTKQDAVTERVRRRLERDFARDTANSGVQAPLSGLGKHKCVAGCQAYHGGEIAHHEGCPYYAESLTKLNKDRLAEKDAELHALREYAINTMTKELVGCGMSLNGARIEANIRLTCQRNHIRYTLEQALKAEEK